MTTTIDQAIAKLETAGEEVLQFVKTLVSDEYNALAPELLSAAESIVADPGALLSISGFKTAFDLIWAEISPKLEATAGTTAAAIITAKLNSMAASL